jgi:hypothetical protein
MRGPDVAGSRGSDSSNGERVGKLRAVSFLDLRACLNDVDVALLPFYVPPTTVAFSHSVLRSESSPAQCEEIDVSLEGKRVHLG